MLKIVLATSGLLLLLLPATQAQQNKWSIGVKGGGTLASVMRTDEQIIGTNFRTAFFQRYTGGLAVQYLTEENFGLQIEVNYTQRGWEERPIINEERSSDRFYRVNLDYAEVPILAHGYFGKKNTRIFANAGVYLAYLLDSNTERANIADDDDINLFYQERYQNTFDFGVRGGGGLEVVTSVGMFQLEGSYSWGINSIMDKGIDQIPNTVQNNTIAVTLGYYVQF